MGKSTRYFYQRFHLFFTVACSSVFHMFTGIRRFRSQPQWCWSKATWYPSLIDTIWTEISINLSFFFFVISLTFSHISHVNLLSSVFAPKAQLEFKIDNPFRPQTQTDFATSGGVSCHVEPINLSMLSTSLSSIRIFYLEIDLV